MNNIVTWSFVFFGISMVLFGVVRANGAVLAPLIVLAISLLGIRFPMALALLGRLHADAIWWSFPASSFLAVVLAMAYYKWGKWRNPADDHAAGRRRAGGGRGRRRRNSLISRAVPRASAPDPRRAPAPRPARSRR